MVDISPKLLSVLPLQVEPKLWAPSIITFKLCLSAITWCGFDNFYYLFPYKQTSDIYKIPHDLDILSEIFNVKKGEYNRNNKYWECYNINSLISDLSNKEQEAINPILISIKKSYELLSNKYQSIKHKNKIPLK